MTQALTTTALGMTIVFLVLALIYGSIVILGLFEPKASVAAATIPPFSTAPAGGPAAVTPEEEAAIHAAIAHHTGRAPETFQTRISPVKKES